MGFIVLIYSVLHKFYFTYFYAVVQGINGDTFSFLDILDKGLTVKESIYYYDSYILYLISIPRYTMYLLATVGFYLWKRKELSWEQLKVPVTFKYFIFSIVLVLSWTYVFYSYNFYIDQYHWLDRAVLLIVGLLVLRSPYFLFFFLPFCLLSVSQMNIPLGGYSLTDKDLLFNLILMMMSWTILKISLPILKVKKWKNNFSVDDHQLFHSFLVVIAAAYFIPFVMKASISPNIIDWPFLDSMDLGFAKYLDRGWLANWDFDRASAINFVTTYQKPLLAIAFLTEFAAVLFPMNRRLAFVLVLNSAFLHLGIFALSGIFFWKWMLADIIFSILVLRKCPKSYYSNIEYTLVSVLLITLSWFWCSSPKLGWYYAPFLNTYTLNVTDEFGEEFEVKLNDMAPYDIFFTFQRWNVFNDKTGQGSTTSPDLKRMMDALIVENKDAYKLEYGVNSYNEKAVTRLNNFLQVYFNNYNEKISVKRSFFSHFKS